jgi:hypothetical protein
LPEEQRDDRYPIEEKEWPETQRRRSAKDTLRLRRYADLSCDPILIATVAACRSSIALWSKKQGRGFIRVAAVKTAVVRRNINNGVDDSSAADPRFERLAIKSFRRA